MSAFKLRIATDNAAFETDDDKRFEIARILRDTAETLEQGGDMEHVLVDINGNRVGRTEIEED